MDDNVYRALKADETPEISYIMATFEATPGGASEFTLHTVGTLTIAGQTVTVNQSAPCSFTISPTTLAEPPAGGTTTANVTTQSGCSWTATST